MSHVLFGVALGEEQADCVMERLGLAGFGSHDVSVLFLDRGLRSFAHGRESRTGGAVTGAAMGWLAGIGWLTIPGEGRFIASGRLMEALSRAAVEERAGVLADWLVRAGLPRREAQGYEDRILDGSILITVESETREEQGKAMGILQAAQVEEIFESGRGVVQEAAVGG